jgi:hypothetical protein
MSESLTINDFSSASEYFFNTYCAMYDLKANCCHNVIGENSYKIYLQNNDYYKTRDLIDDAIRYILKPYRKRYRGKNIGNKTDDINIELSNIKSL